MTMTISAYRSGTCGSDDLTGTEWRIGKVKPVVETPPVLSVDGQSYGPGQVGPSKHTTDDSILQVHAVSFYMGCVGVQKPK